jgi:NAD(P)H-dependent flavin oxidoreductase YrpB (nitropropane dioxygenase family)
MIKTRLCELLDIEYPIIQAPMDWITNAELVAAVSNAGGLGVLGPNAGQRTITTSVEETGERLRREIRKVRALTDKPFGVNLISMKSSDNFPEDSFSDKCHQVVLEERVPVVVFVGDAPWTYAPSLQAAGIKVLHRPIVMTSATAVEAERAGVDALVAVGCEGGGHPGSISEPTSVMVPCIVDAVRIPVVAGGGIADGRGVAAALAWGAEGAYIGTRFMATTQCTAHENLKRAVVEAGEESTIILPSALGALRALKGPVMARCQEMQARGCTVHEITETYHAGYMPGMLEGDRETGTFVCGAGCVLVKRIQDACEVVREIVEEAENAISRAAGA